VVSLTSVVASEGKAAEKTGSAAATAKACFKRGRTHYQLGEYREALKEFKEAYRLRPDASFLYNIAQCHRQLGEISDAIKLYGSYLREAPDAANRAEVERQIRELKATAEKQEQASAAPAAPPQPGSPEPASPLPSAAALPASKPPAPAAAATPAPAPTPMPLAGLAGSAAIPAYASAPMGARAPDVPAELEVIPDPPEANILVNHIAVATHGPVKLRLPPGLYSVALEREGFRSAEGAVTLVGGDHARLAGTLTETRTHGWNSLGHAFVVLGVLSGAVAIAAHVEANRKPAGSSDFNKWASTQIWSEVGAITTLTLAATCYVLDWLVNRDKVEPGPPSMLLPAAKETP
jgi:hypothetical protein